MFESLFEVSTLAEISIAAEHYLTNGIGRRLLSLLVHAVVTSHSPVGSLCFYCLAIWTNQHAGHHTERAITCKWQSMKYWLRLHGSKWQSSQVAANKANTNNPSTVWKAGSPLQIWEKSLQRPHFSLPYPSQRHLLPEEGLRAWLPALPPSSMTVWLLWLSFLTYNMGITKHPLNRLDVRIRWILMFVNKHMKFTYSLV